MCDGLCKAELNADGPIFECDKPMDHFPQDQHAAFDKTGGGVEYEIRWPLTPPIIDAVETEVTHAFQAQKACYECGHPWEDHTPE